MRYKLGAKLSALSQKAFIARSKVISAIQGQSGPINLNLTFEYAGTAKIGIRNANGQATLAGQSFSVGCTGQAKLK